MSTDPSVRLLQNLLEKTAAPEGVERLPSGDLKYRDEIFPGYNKPKNAPAGSKHKKRVLAKKGDKVKVVNFGARGYKHNYSAEAKRNYLARSAGIKGKDDKFSANYWSRRELWPKNQKADGSARKKTAQMDSGLSLQYLKDKIDDLSMAAMSPAPALPRHMQRAAIRRQSGFNAEAAIAKIDRLGSKLDALMAQQEQARQQAAQSVGGLGTNILSSSSGPSTASTGPSTASSGATVSNNIVFPTPTGDPSQDFMSSLGKNVALPAGVAALAAALVSNFSKQSSLKKN